MYPDNLSTRLATYAAELGSKAATTRGQLRAVCADPERARRVIRDFKPHVEGAREAVSPQEADVRRAMSDPRFRTRWLRRVRAELAAVPPAGADYHELFARHAELRAQATRVAPPAWRVVLRATLPASAFRAFAPLGHVAEYLGWDHRGLDSRFLVGMRFAAQHTPGETTWRGGRAVSYRRAERVTTIQSVLVTTSPTSCRLEMRGTKRTVRLDIPCAASSVSTRGLLPGDLYSVERSGGVLTRYDARQNITGVSVPLPELLREQYGLWEHGLTYADCGHEIGRKLSITRANFKSERVSDPDRRAARLLARLSTAPVVLADARAAGFCHAGIAAWCTARGIDSSATVAVRTLARDDDPQARQLAVRVASRIWAARRGKAVAA